MSLLKLAALGAVVGLPLGYALQRTNLCFNSAYRELIMGRKTFLLRMIVLSVVVQMVGLALLVQFHIGGVQTNVVPFYWLGTTLGAFIFGIAIVYAEGCSSTVWYRVGNGNLGALVTLVAFALGEWLLRFGPLSGLLKLFQSQVISLPGDRPSTLPFALGISPWLLVIPIALIAVWWLRQGRPGGYLDGWDWRLGGLVLGLIGVFAWIAAWPTGWHYGIGIVGATGAFIQAIFSGVQVLNWGSFMVLAMPLGAFFAAWHTHHLRLQIPNAPSTLRMFIAGLVMGVSATLAGGCNIGHGFTGLPTLALSSITATLFTFLGAAAGNYWRFILPRQPQAFNKGQPAQTNRA